MSAGASVGCWGPELLATTAGRAQTGIEAGWDTELLRACKVLPILQTVPVRLPLADHTLSYAQGTGCTFAQIRACATFPRGADPWASWVETARLCIKRLGGEEVHSSSLAASLHLTCCRLAVCLRTPCASLPASTRIWTCMPSLAAMTCCAWWTSVVPTSPDVHQFIPCCLPALCLLTRICAQSSLHAFLAAITIRSLSWTSGVSP